MALYTDIATEIYKKNDGSIPQGVETQRFCAVDIEVTRVVITRKGLNRAKGSYSIIDMPNLSLVDDRNDRYISSVATELSRLLPKSGLVMVIGLGNEAVTADSLGPLTARKIFVTRRLGETADNSDLRLRDVCAFTPGVVGRTGIDTVESISAMVKKIKPAAVICVDSLYTNEPRRLGCTVQLTDTGLSPGGAYTLSAETLGCPTIAIGVPTMKQHGTSDAQLIVTMRQLDSVMEKASNILSLSINRAIQKSLTSAEISYLVS